MARQTLRSNRKFKRLNALLGIPEPYVLGLLEMLWGAAYENGDDIVGDASDVELAAGWPGKPGVLAVALLNAGGDGRPGFIEEIETNFYRIHDLWDHAPEYVRKRAKREANRRATGKTLGQIRAEAGALGGAARARSIASKRQTSGSKRKPLASDFARTTEVTENTDVGSKRLANGTTPSLLPVREKRKGAPETKSAPPKPADLLSVWNLNRGPLPAAMDLSPDRERHARARLSEITDLSRWKAGVVALSVSPFCTGQNDRGWKADFDFLLRPGTLLRIEEGKYADRSKPKTNGHHRLSPELSPDEKRARDAEYARKLEEGRRALAEQERLSAQQLVLSTDDHHEDPS